MHQSLHPHDGAVLIIDAMELRRAGIVSLLQPWADSSGTSLKALAPCETLLDPSIQQLRIIVLVMGALGVKDREPTDWIRSLSASYPNVPLVLISEREEPEQAVAAFKAGARGFIPMSLAPSVAFHAFTFIMQGGSFYPPAALACATPEIDDAADDEDAGSVVTTAAEFVGGHLTMRQKEVLDHLRQGESNKLIARQLKMRESTVKVHVRQIMRKLGAANRTQAALAAIHITARVRSVGVQLSEPEQSGEDRTARDSTISAIPQLEDVVPVARREKRQKLPYNAASRLR